MTKIELATALATAMNILNSVIPGNDDVDEISRGEFNGLADLMPEHIDYRNNGTVSAEDLI